MFIRSVLSCWKCIISGLASPDDLWKDNFCSPGLYNMHKSAPGWWKGAYHATWLWVQKGWYWCTSVWHIVIYVYLLTLLFQFFPCRRCFQSISFTYTFVMLRISKVPKALSWIVLVSSESVGQIPVSEVLCFNTKGHVWSILEIQAFYGCPLRMSTSILLWDQHKNDLGSSLAARDLCTVA